MKRPRIPNLPINWTRQPDGKYRCRKTGEIKSIHALQRLYSRDDNQKPTEEKQESVEVKNQSWHQKYENY